MDGSDDLLGMLRRVFSDAEAERLLGSDKGVPTRPEEHELAAVAQVLDGLRTAGTEEELAGADQVVAEMMAAMRAAPPITTPVRSPMFSRRSTRIAVATAASSLLFAGTAAAATGNLPEPVQRTISASLAHVGIDLPTTSDIMLVTTQDAGLEGAEAAADPSDEPVPTSVTDASQSPPPDDPSAATDPISATDETETEQADEPEEDGDSNEPAPQPQPEDPSATFERGPDPIGPAHHGLCTAWAATIKHGKAAPSSVAFANLREAAETLGQTIADFCADALDSSATSTTTSESPPSDDDVATEGLAPAPTSVDEVERGNGRSGSSPSDTAPGRTKDKGTKGKGRSGG